MIRNVTNIENCLFTLMSNCKPVGPKAFTGGHSGYEAPKTEGENGISLDADRKNLKKPLTPMLS